MPNRKRFGGNGFTDILNYIRNHGMIPGLWIEPEVAGINNWLAQKPDDWFLSRHGRRIIYNFRYFLNLRNGQVRQYLDEVIDRIVNEYGIGYIKNDYNIDLHQGTDTDADSFGDGLLEHTRAYYNWLENIHKRHPDLIWENCAGGGLRSDYGMLSRTQLLSSSDLTDYSRYAALAIGCSAAVLQEQMAVWSYPVETDGQEGTIYNMVNSILFRIHLSGQIDLLDSKCKDLVKEAIDYYKHTRYLISSSYPIYPLSFSLYNNDGCWLAIGMRRDNFIRLALWRKNSPQDTYVVPFESYGKVTSIKCVYPCGHEYKPNISVENSGVAFTYKERLSARVFEIELN